MQGVGERKREQEKEERRGEKERRVEKRIQIRGCQTEKNVPDLPFILADPLAGICSLRSWLWNRNKHYTCSVKFSKSHFIPWEGWGPGLKGMFSLIRGDSFRLLVIEA